MRTATLWALLCAGGLAWGQERFTPEQLLAKFYYDLGPDSVDVSAYPEPQRAVYGRFKETCSQCHTLARAVNAPFLSRKEWGKYVRRMHLISEEWPKTRVSEADAKAILEFLVFDSKKRKVEGRKAFQAQSESLKALFDKVQTERLRIHSTR